MKLTAWGAPRAPKKETAGDKGIGSDWRCSRPQCDKRRMLNQRYCKACHAAYERIRRHMKGAFA